METVDITHSLVGIGYVVATILMFVGWASVPPKYKQLIIAAGLMFVGFSIFEHLCSAFISIKL